MALFRIYYYQVSLAHRLVHLCCRCSQGEIKIGDVLPFGPVVDAALCHGEGVCEGVRDDQGELNTHTFSTPHTTTIAVVNQVCSSFLL